MNTVEWILWGLSLVTLIAVILLAGFSTLRAREWKSHAQLRQSNPRQFRDLVLIGRCSGPLVAMFSAGALIAAPLYCLQADFGILLFVVIYAASSFALWYSIRYLRWAWCVKLQA